MYLIDSVCDLRKVFEFKVGRHGSVCNFGPLSTDLDNNKRTSQQQYDEARYIKIRASLATTNQVTKILCILSIGLNIDHCL